MLTLQFDQQGDKIILDIPPSKHQRRVVLMMAQGRYTRIAFDAPEEIVITRAELIGTGRDVRREK